MTTTKVNTEFIAVNAISGTIIADGAITSTHLAANCVDSSELVTGSIDTIHIAANQVTSAKIVSDAVLTRHIADDQVTQALIAVNSVGVSELNLSEGTDGQVLTTNGAGTLSFADAAGGVDGIVSSADATAITIDSSEKVGIGTASPQKALNVFADNTAPVRFERNTSDGQVIQIYKDSSAVSSIGTNSIGLGVVPETWFSTIRPIQVGLGASFAGNTANASRAYLSANYYINSSNQESYIATDEASQYFQNAGTHTFKVAPSGSADSAITFTTAMTIDNSGNVGIGATTVDEKIHVEVSSGDAAIKLEDASGDFVRIDQNSVGANDKIRFKTGSNLDEHMRITSTGNVGINETSPDFSGFGSNGGGLELDDVGSSFTAVKVSQGSTGNLYLAASTGAGYLWQHSNSPLIIGTNNAERIRIQDGTGRMGINSVGIAYSSGEKLSLQNDNFGFGIKTTSTPMGIWHTGTSGTYLGVAYGSGGAGGGGITFSGASTSYTSASDYRLKENVDYAWDATTRIKHLKPCRFNWISDSTNTLQDGFLAHEVSSIVPGAVTGEKDAVYTAEEAENEPNTAEGDAKIQALDNAKLVPLLVKTIQELEARITTLEG